MHTPNIIPRRTDRITDKQTNIYSIFRDKLSLHRSSYNNQCSSLQTAQNQNFTVLEQHEVTKCYFTNGMSYSLCFNLQTALNHNITILEQHKIKQHHFTNST